MDIGIIKLLTYGSSNGGPSEDEVLQPIMWHTDRDFPLDRAVEELECERVICDVTI